ncbi:MAG: PAS domain-containing protein, partial [Comamonadaceae bacterium]
MPRPMTELQALSQVLDAIDVGFCAFDGANRTLLWNRAFLQMFPEHAGHIHVGEPVADNLRRLPSGQQAPADALLAGPAAQLHHVELDDGRSIHVASIAVPDVGRVSVWRARPARSSQPEAAALEDGELLSRRDLERGYRLLAELSSEVIVAVVGGRIDYVSPSVA